MNSNAGHHQKMAKLTYAAVYPSYLNKIEKKGRSQAELEQVIQWLTGFNENQLSELINQKVTFEEFFEKATLNPNAHLIKGVICGWRIEEIENSLTQKIRYLDKLVDELAKAERWKRYSENSSYRQSLIKGLCFSVSGMLNTRS